MPNDRTTKETEILGNIAEILFGSHHHANITRAHANGEIINKRMRLLMESSYWDRMQPQPIEKQITKIGYQPTTEENKSLKSLYRYIKEQVQLLCKKGTLDVLNSADARKRGSSKAKGLDILQENQNPMERYLTVLRGLFDDLPEQTTTFPNPFRIKRDTSGNDGTKYGIATYSYKGRLYSLRLIVAAIWQATSEENSKKWTNTLGNLSQEEATLTSKENFISVLAECLRAYNQDNGPNSFTSPDNPSCDLGAAERLLLRGAPFNKCFLPSESEDQQDKLINIQHSVDHYLIDKLENFCKESDKALMFRVLSNRVLMDEPDVLAEETYQAIFKNFTNLLSSEEQDPNDLYYYLVKCLSGFPWQSDFKLNVDVFKTRLFELLVTRIDVFTSIELENPYGLMNAENQNSLNRLLMLCSHSLANTIWADIYQNIGEAKEFEQDRIRLKALEELIDAEYGRCALAPGLFYTNKTQHRLNKLFSKCEEISSQFTSDRGTSIKEQVDQLSQEKLKNEFAQEITYDTKHIIHYTLSSIDNRLQRLDKKCVDVTPESINTLYQASFETLWDDPLSTQEEPILSIAPKGIRLNKKNYQDITKITEKQQMLLKWSMYIANLAVCFDQKGHVDRQRDILRGFAAMRGQTLLDSIDFEAETFAQESDHLSGEDIEDVIWIACSVIRELDISAEQRKTAWSALENACKDNEIFSRHTSLDYLLGKLHENLNDKDNIWPKLLGLFAKLEKGKETISSDSWRSYGKSFHREKHTQNLTWFSLLSIMSSLKLGYLHIGNQQSLSLYCKLFHGDHSSFNPAEEKSYRAIIESGKLKCTIEGLADYLQKVVNLINSNQNFHSAFAEGIMAAIPRERAEQLVWTVQSFTEKSILCVRLSSSRPDQVAVTRLMKDRKPDHILYSVDQYYQGIKTGSLGGIQLSGTHRIMPGGNFDHKALLEQQKKQYVRALDRYVKPSSSSGLGSALQKLDSYTPAYSNLPQSTLFTKSSDSSSSERESKRELRPG